MDGKSLNITQELLQQLQAIIPQAFSEGKLDTTALKTLLGEEVFVQGERYGLSWAGKSEAYKVLQQSTTTTLIPEPEQSIDWDKAQHVFIEGENLDVLKLLQKSYFGQVKMIYIDPPYNTGSDSFIYPDKFSETKEEYLQRIGDKNDEGYILREGAFRPNRKESGQYHSNWLNMMLPRLYLARNLLRDDGVIFVSIDDNEAANLKLLMDEVFGELGFIGNLLWRRRVSSGLADNNVSTDHEYVLCYKKNEIKSFRGINKTFESYSNIDNDPRGDWIADNLTVGMTASMRPNQAYDLIDPLTRNVYKCNPNRVWAYIPESMDRLISEGRIIFPKDPSKRPMLKRFKNDLKSDKNPFSSLMIDKVGLNTEATRTIQDILGGNIFEYSKPISLVNLLLQQVTEKDDVVLDFFAGSGTTAHAVMELNEEDGGNRRYICVQLPEKTDENSEAAKAGYVTIADITAARIKKVIAKIEAERAAKTNKNQTDLLSDSKPLPNLGFRKFTLAPSNFKLWRGDGIETEEELSRQMRLFSTPQRANATTPDMVWELLLKSGYGLTEAVTMLALEDGLTIYHTADKRLALVLDGFSHAVQAAVLQLKPKKVILLDAVFSGRENPDSLKTNAQLTFEDQGIAFKTV